MPIVTSTYRYKRPPRKRKAVALDVPAIVTSVGVKKLRPATRRKAAPQPANDDGQRTSAIVAAKKDRRPMYRAAAR